MTETRALTWLAIAAVLAIAWLAHPFGAGLLIGALLAFTLEPVYEWLKRRTHRPVLASLATVGASAVVIIGAVAGFVTLFVTHAVTLSNAVREELHPGGALTPWVDAVTGWLARFGISTESLTARLQAAAGEIASQSAAFAGLL